MRECKNCLKLKEFFDVAKHNPHGNLRSAYDLMRELYNQKKITLYMSDCSFENFLEEIHLEKHYTYHLYLKCTRCQKIFFLGVCIRGVPLYETLDREPDKEKFKYQCLRDNMIFYEE